MLQNAYFLGKIGADTAENEQHFAEVLPTDGALPFVEDTEPQKADWQGRLAATRHPGGTECNYGLLTRSLG